MIMKMIKIQCKLWSVKLKLLTRTTCGSARRDADKKRPLVWKKYVQSILNCNFKVKLFQWHDKMFVKIMNDFNR